MTKQMQACQCNAVGDWIRDENGEFEFSECGQETRGTFAPGHDAKLKGVLTRLHRSNDVYTTRSGGLRVSVPPMVVAVERGWGAFLLKDAKRPVRSEKPVKAPKLTKKDEKALAKLVAGIQPYIEASAQADPPIVASTFAEVKVGRWWYDVLASISHDDSGNALVKYGRKGKGESALATIKPMFFSSHLR